MSVPIGRTATGIYTIAGLRKNDFMYVDNTVLGVAGGFGKAEA